MNLKTFNAPTLLPTMPGCTPQNPCGVPYNIFMKDLFYMGGGSGSLFDPAYQAVIDYALTQGFMLPSMAVMNIQNTLVIDLKASGIWDDLDVYYNFITDGDRDFACINWKAPGTFTAVRNGGILFRPFDGFEGNGTNAFLDTQWSPNVNGIGYTLNDASVFISIGSDIQNTTAWDYGAISGAATLQFNSGRVNGVQIGLNSSNNNLGVAGSSQAFWHQSRNGGLGANHRVFRNGLLNVASGDPVSAIPPLNIYILARNNANAGQLFSPRIIRTFGAGASLSGKEAALYNDWATYVSSMALVAYSSEYVAILQYAVSQGFAIPSANVRQYQDQLLRSLIGNGIWDELDVYYNFLTDGDINFAKINWKNPGAFQLPVGGVFTSLIGLKFTIGLSTGLTIGALPGGKYFLNSASFFSAALQDVSMNGAFIVTQPNIVFNIFPSGPTFMQLQVNDGTPNNLSGLSLLTEGFFHAQRLGGNRRGFINGVQVGLHSLPPVATPANPIILGTSANFYQQCFGLGSSLSGKEANLYNVWQAYKYLIQANVIHNAILDYATSQGFALPTYPVRNASRKLIANLLRTGIWDQLDVFYNFVTDGDAGYACINWKNPGVNQAIPVGTVTFNTFGGFDFAGGHMTTGFIADANAKFQGGNASLIVDCDAWAPTDFMFGAFEGTRWSTIQRSNNRYVVSTNGFSGSYIGPLVLDGKLFHAQNNTRIRAFIDGILFQDVGSAASVFTPYTIPFIIGGTPGLRVPNVTISGLKLHAIGGSLNNREADLYNSWHAYKINIEQISITF